MKAKIVLKGNAVPPAYATPGSAGMDLQAFLESPVTINPMQALLIPTGISISLAPGYEAQIRPRSGLAAKYGVTVLNAPGTVDSDYRGEVKVLLINLGPSPHIINPGDRIAQMVVHSVEKVEWEVTDTLDETERGDGGFGHTGK